MSADLVNAAPDPDALQQILLDYAWARPTLNAEEIEQLVRWCGSLRRVFGVSDLDHQVELVNGLLATGASRPFVSQHDGNSPHLHFVSELDDVVPRVRAQTAAGLASVLCEEGGDRLGACARPGCDLVYIDTSRNGRRRFCSLRCANRVRVADHRRRAS